MFKELFEKYIDFSKPKHKHILKEIKDVKDFDEALAIVIKKMVITDSLIAKLKAEAKTFDDEEADKVKENKETEEEKLLAAEEEAARIKAENEEKAKIGRRQGEGKYS